jgi:hypothetical protein
MKLHIKSGQRSAVSRQPKAESSPVSRRSPAQAEPFDIAALLSSAGGEGVSLPALVLLARDITGNLALTEADLRPHLTALLSRGVLTCTGGRWKLK